MSEIDDFSILKHYEYRAFYGTVDLGPFTADPVIRLNARHLSLPVYDSATGNERSLTGTAQLRAEIELALRDGAGVFEMIASAGIGHTCLKFVSIDPDLEKLIFPCVDEFPKIQYVPSGKFGHQAVLTFYATADSDGILYTFA